MNRTRTTRKIALELLAGACAAGSPALRRAAAADTITMRLGITTPITAVFGQVAAHFALAVERRTREQLKIEVYPSGQLAKEAESIGALASGVLDLQIQSTAFVQALVPQYQALDLPFLFKDTDAAFRVLQGPIGDELFAALEPKGIVGLCWGTGGFRELQTVKPVTVPEDMKGLRIRIQPGQVYVAMMQALGAVPVTIDFAEVFTALTQHTIDGADLNVDGFASSKLYSVVKNMAMSNHIFSTVTLLGSKRKVDALPKELRDALKLEARALVPFWRATSVKQIAEEIVLFRQNGVKITEIQYPAFRKAMDPVYATFASRLGGDFIERISRAAGART